jgi:acyl dehydratase
VIRFPVESAHVMMFARAIGDPNPAYYAGDESIAPPTFAIASDHYDPDYERRPRIGEPWFGSGREAVSVQGGSQQAPSGGSGFHAEERIVYHRPIRVGDLLSGETREGRSETKQGRRGGRLHFREHVTELCNASGAPAVTLTWVDVLTERSVDGRDAAAHPAERETRASADPEDATLDTRPQTVRWGDRTVAVGSVHEQVVVDDLRRTQIVQYAGASGDFHPMHTDEPYARAMGMPGTFAHGMLTMGLAGIALTDCCGIEPLSDYGARFQGIVWPGDTLTTRVRLAGIVRGEGPLRARLEIETRNQDRQAVLTGRAHAYCQLEEPA